MIQGKLFPLGQIVATPAALDAMERNGQPIFLFTAMHSCGNWGTLSPEDKKMNDDAITKGGRIFSAYHLKDGEKIWVITEAGRHATTVLLPEDY